MSNYHRSQADWPAHESLHTGEESSPKDPYGWYGSSYGSWYVWYGRCLGGGEYHGDVAAVFDSKPAGRGLPGSRMALEGSHEKDTVSAYRTPLLTFSTK